MTKVEFGGLWSLALEQAARNADEALGRRVSRSFVILLHGAGSPGSAHTPEAALDRLYLGPDRSFGIIDVAVLEVAPGSTTLFVRASDHRPRPFEQTWNQPPGMGPFKQILASRIRVQGGEEPRGSG